MIRALFKTQNGFYESFVISGHSGYSEEGSDIICASVSSMTNLVFRMFEETNSAYEVASDAEKPEVILTVKTVTRVTEQIIHSLYCEVMALSQDYPQFVKVKKQ